MSRNGFKGLPCITVKRICACILKCLKFLHKNQIIHCDLKPENILMIRPGYPSVKVIDFGSSCYVGRTIYTYIQSRFYRAPEVILGMEYDTAIDIWSFGCITMELLTGTPLFPGTDEFDQVACIVEVLDLPPPSFVRNARRLNSFFCDSGRLRYHSADREKFCFSGASFTRTVQRAQPGSLTLEVLLQHSLGDVDPDLLDFVQRCLCWRTEKMPSTIRKQMKNVPPGNCLVLQRILGRDSDSHETTSIQPICLISSTSFPHYMEILTV
ncbi:hypothetical protein AAHC03_01750 [Spirometra sp. Aus1]